MQIIPNKLLRLLWKRAFWWLEKSKRRGLRKGNQVLYHGLLVYPIVLGSGKRLFPNAVNGKRRLVESKQFPTGVVFLRYAVNKMKDTSDYQETVDAIIFGNNNNSSCRTAKWKS